METITKHTIYSILETVCDPEIPVLTILDLGIVRDVILEGDEVEIVITPTYSGCPAMDAISMDIRMKLLEQGFKKIKIRSVLSPVWTTDWMSEDGKRKLKEYGIAPPQPATAGSTPPCPQCLSGNTVLVSQFGSTACKALYKCLQCQEPFDYFKCH